MALSVYNSAAFSTASGVAVAGGATVTVRLESSGALATIYSNRDAAGSPSLANPFTADSVGRFSFYASLVDQGYSVRVQFGAEDHTVSNVLDLILGTKKTLEEYGAIGDGISDDTSAWTSGVAAIGAIGELHGTPGKTYLIGASGITISSKTNAGFIGNGAGIKLNAVATQSPSGLGSTAIFIDTCTNVKFSGWVIDGNSKASNLIGMKSSTECEISGNRMSTGGLSGQVFGLGNTRCRYLDNEFISGTGASRGMWLGNYATGHMEADIEVAGNIIRSMGATGIVCSSVGGRIYGNHIESLSAGSGIIFGGANGFSSKKLTIFGNTCRSCASHGIQSDVAIGSPVSATNLPVDIAITGNICDSNNGSGIYAVNLSKSSIIGNICSNNNADSSGTDAGIYIDDVDVLSVTGNVCHDTRTSSPDSRTQNIGIEVAASNNNIDIKNLTIFGNTCYNNSQRGIGVQTVAAVNLIDNLSLSCNTCVDNGAHGIIVSEATALTVSRVAVIGNVCHNNGTADLRVDPLDVNLNGNVYTTYAGIEYYTFTALDTTPSVKGRKNFLASNGSATSISAFDDGVNGQDIVIRSANANTTIVHGGFLILKGATNTTIPANGIIGLRREDTVWFEMFRSY